MTKSTRQTIVLINGVEGSIVSCLLPNAVRKIKGVNTKDPSDIVAGLADGRVTLLGHATVRGDHLCNVVNTDGKTMVSPNRAERVKLIDVGIRQKLGKLFDVAPVQLQEQVTGAKEIIVWAFGKMRPVKKNSRGTTYVDVDMPCYNNNPDHYSVIKGFARVNGNKVQGFIPDDKKVKHSGKRWYCTGCTSEPVGLTKHSDAVKKLGKPEGKNPLWPTAFSTVGSATMEIKFVGSNVDEILKLVTAFQAKMK